MHQQRCRHRAWKTLIAAVAFVAINVSADDSMEIKAGDVTTTVPFIAPPKTVAAFVTDSATVSMLKPGTLHEYAGKTYYYLATRLHCSDYLGRTYQTASAWSFATNQFVVTEPAVGYMGLLSFFWIQQNPGHFETANSPSESLTRYVMDLGGFMQQSARFSDEYTTERLVRETEEKPFNYTGTFVADGPTSAQRILSPDESGYSVSKLKYKIKTVDGYAGTVAWLEVFDPADQSQPDEYRFMTWQIPPNVTESGEYTIDPLDPANYFKHPGTSGSYRLQMLDFSLAVDADRDGTIKLATEDESDATTAEKPFRFWINDDDDSGDTSGTDIPMGVDVSGSGPMGPANWQGSGADFKVNGTRDLIDLFPVFLDIKQLVAVLPPSANVIYKLKQEEGALNLVYTGLTRIEAQKYQTQETDAIFGPGLSQKSEQADKQWITAEGVDIFSTTKVTGSKKFLDAIQNHDGGVILVEGRKATKKPLVLSVEKGDGTVIAEIKLELKLSPVEQMFRHLNLRNGPDAPSGLIGQTDVWHAATATNMTEPKVAYPDEPGEPKWLIFVHGYNVSGEKARGWTTEMFKRFYWSHNRARFVGVTWFGNPSTGNNNIVQGYHWAVRNAVPSAQALAAKINALPGGKTVIGHSQGCWLTAIAVADYGLSISNLCLVDAAFAQECLEGDSATDTTNMVPTEWQAYPTGTWSANWFRHFTDGGLPSSDARSTLTWNSRLVSALVRTAVSSFYSSTEDVLATYQGTPTAAVVDDAYHAVADWDLSKLGNFAWVAQEKTKGSKALFTQGSDYGGWGPNLTDRPDGSSDPIYYWVNGAGGRFLLSPNELPQLDVAMVRRAPIFDPGYSHKSGAFRNYDPSVLRGPSWIQQLYDSTSDTTSGGAIAAAHRTELLAEAFPALSLPVGANRTSTIGGRNYNMPDVFAKSSRWPDSRGVDTLTGLPNWHHSDMRAVAYLYTYMLFDQIKIISESTP